MIVSVREIDRVQGKGFPLIRKSSCNLQLASFKAPFPMTLQNVNKKSEVYLFRLLSSATFWQGAYIALVSPSYTLLCYITRLVAKGKGYKTPYS